MDASLQVENFISHVGNLSPDDFPPVLDIEKMEGCPVEQLNRRALEWLKAIEKFKHTEIYGPSEMIAYAPQDIFQSLSA